MIEFILVLVVATSSVEEWSVLDSGMTATECTQALRTAPQPYTHGDVTVSYSCQLENGD